MPSCPHRPPCPGCPRFGERNLDPVTYRSLSELAQAHGLSAVPVISSKPSGFRLRARLAIRGRVASPKIGMFESDSHRVVHIPNCVVHHPLINHVAGIVRGALVDARISCYSDSAHMGLARHLQIVVERSSQTAQLVLVANCSQVEPLTACFELIRERLGDKLHSLWFNSNCGRSNSIFGPQFQKLHGADATIEHFGGAAVHYPPGAFGQNNLDVAQNIIEQVREQIPQGAQVAEFYAGVGAIGLSVLPKTGAIRMNEMSPQSLQGLSLGVAALDDASRARISISPGPAGESRLMVDEAQVVIADPPRKGLDPELTQYLNERPPERFLYVSCGIDSFLKDAAVLMSHDRLRLAAISAFDLLPFTSHVETVACFERA